jgi:L-lactate dehydrogenase
MINMRKVAVVGCGFVGSSSAFALMQSGLFSEMVLIDADKNRAEGEAMDISHGLPYASPMKIYAADYDAVSDAAVVVVTAGAAQKPGETRLDLVHKNVGIMRSIIPQIVASGFEGILLIVANPVDILTAAAVKLSGYPENRVIGSGTTLDTARLKYRLGEHLGVDSRSVNAFIIGEHGDSELAAWSCVDVGGLPLPEFCEMRGHYHDHVAAAHRIYEEVKNSAYTIIEKKRATYYGVAMAVKRICECIVRNERSILPVSTMIHGDYGIEGVALSLPTVVGQNGMDVRVPIHLNEEEIEQLRSSARVLKETLDTEFPE